MHSRSKCLAASAQHDVIDSPVLLHRSVLHYFLQLNSGLAKALVYFFFPYNGSSNPELSLTSFKTFLLDCIVTAVISVCI